MLKVWIFCSVFKLREDPIQHSQYTPGVLKSVVIVILFHSCHRLSPSNRFLSFVEFCSTKSNHDCRVFCYLWLLSAVSLSILPSISTLAIVCHPFFLKCSCHFLSTLLQNQTMIVEFSVIYDCFLCCLIVHIAIHFHPRHRLSSFGSCHFLSTLLQNQTILVWNRHELDLLKLMWVRIQWFSVDWLCYSWQVEMLAWRRVSKVNRASLWCGLVPPWPVLLCFTPSR